MTEEIKKQLIRKGQGYMVEIYETNQSGYAGVLSTGELVSRLDHPEAIPVPKNTLMNIPKPKHLPDDRISDNVCFDCGKHFLTDLQKILNGRAVTSFVSVCGICEEEKATTDIRTFNYLRLKTMNFRELRKGMIIIQNSLTRLQSMTSHETGNTSREIATAFTSTQLAMMWTGTFMKFAKMGDNPYATHDGTRETIEDIEPLFDATQEEIADEIFGKGRIYTIDQIREYLDKQLTAVHQHGVGGEPEKHLTKEELAHADLCLQNIYSKITEARMWLGMELGRIRDNEK